MCDTKDSVVECAFKLIGQQESKLAIPYRADLEPKWGRKIFILTSNGKKTTPLSPEWPSIGAIRGMWQIFDKEVKD
jgi:hypothetical protein